jgi:hypothetical protein
VPNGKVRKSSKMLTFHLIISNQIHPTWLNRASKSHRCASNDSMSVTLTINVIFEGIYGKLI